MLRTFLLVLPVTLASTLAALLVMIPVTWMTRDIRPIYAAARVLLRGLLWLAGVRVETSGPDPWSAPQPCLYLSNHASNLDPPIVFLYLPRVVIMGKAVVFRWPLLGYALKMAEFIPVDRGQAGSRRQAMETGIGRLKKGLSLLIFPEGTRSPDGALLPFRPGPFTMAIETQAPVVPITILGARELMPKGRLGIQPGRVKIVFHPPIPTAGLTATNRDALMQRARDAIASALNPSS